VGASRLLGGTGENEMTGRRIEATTLAVVVLAAAALYSARLSHVPSFLSNDETAFGLQAHAIATTAHDENGRLLPLYFQMMENVWFHPALVYWMAPILAVVRPTPWAVRLPTVIIAMINLVLVFALGRRLGLSRAAAIGASVLLSVTPAHLLHGRLACDYLLPVPCVLAWLIMLIDAHKSGASWRFFAAGCILGVGLYTYIASLVTMPVCLFLSYVAMYSSGIRRLRPYAMITTGFAVLLVPAATYLLAVPQLYAGFSARYGGANVDVLHDPRAMFEFDIMAKRWAVYRSFFEWRFLFEKAETPRDELDLHERDLLEGHESPHSHRRLSHPAQPAHDVYRTASGRVFHGAICSQPDSRKVRDRPRPHAVADGCADRSVRYRLAAGTASVVCNLGGKGFVRGTVRLDGGAVQRILSRVPVQLPDPGFSMVRRQSPWRVRRDRPTIRFRRSEVHLSEQRSAANQRTVETLSPGS
jgi:hypothetical protein